jgi:hypothetical protein
MKARKLTGLLCFLFFTVTVQAQVNVLGYVADTLGNVVNRVTVRLINGKDTLQTVTTE